MKKLNIKKILPIFILLVAILGTGIVVSQLIGKVNSKSQDVDRISVAGPKSTYTINKEFTFPLKDSKDKKITEVKFTLDGAELRDEIIVKGQRATAVQGRTFLILNLKMSSSFTKGLQVNSKDYFRLTMNDKESEMLAPDIHNDPVIIEPTSTKFTRVGWAINDSDQKLILHVGEVGGEKTKVEINF